MLVGIARPARRALGAIQLFRTGRNRMNRLGARSMQIAPDRSGSRAERHPRATP